MGQKWDKSTPAMPKPSFHRVIEMCAHEGGDYTLTFVSTSVDFLYCTTCIARAVLLIVTLQLELLSRSPSLLLSGTIRNIPVGLIVE